MSCKVDNKFFTAGLYELLHMWNYVGIQDWRWKGIKFSKSSLLFVTMMLRFAFHLLLVVVSRFFSAVLRFSFLRSGLVQTTVIFQKLFALTREIIATKISRWPTRANFFPSRVKFSTTRERFLTTRLVVYCHSFTRLYKPRATREVAVWKTRFSESR